MGLLVLLLVAAPFYAHAGEIYNSPTVTFLTPQPNTPQNSPTPDSDALFTAIRAQLSALPVVLTTRQYRAGDSLSGSPRDAAQKQAVMNGAKVVFWVEQAGSQVNVHFYLPRKSGEKYINRVLDVPSVAPETRYETVAVAVASTLEGLLDEVESSDAMKTADAHSAQPPRPLVSSYGKGQRRALVEVAIGYSGLAFAPDAVNQGGSIRLGIAPHRLIHLSVGFTQFLSHETSIDVLSLLLQTRHLDVGICAEIMFGAFSLRPGLFWIGDIRRYAATALHDSTTPGPDGFKFIHSLAPTLQLIWYFKKNLGLFVQARAMFSVNETTYKIEQPDGATIDVLAPYTIKPAWQTGLLVQL